MSELKPCPFCGGDELEIFDNNGYFVGCQNPKCFAEMPSTREKENAIKAWNTRDKASHNNTAKEQQSTIDSLNEIVEAVIKYRDFDGLCEVETESDLWGEVVGLLEQHNKDKP